MLSSFAYNDIILVGFFLHPESLGQNVVGFLRLLMRFDRISLNIHQTDH